MTFDPSSIELPIGLTGCACYWEHDIERAYRLGAQRGYDNGKQEGADKELEACIDWIACQLNCTDYEDIVPYLREFRRPKAEPTKKEIALKALGKKPGKGYCTMIDDPRYDVILEALTLLSNGDDTK